MEREIRELVAAARARRGEAAERDALEEWRTITARARALRDEDGLAFGLRHFADLALRCVRPEEALRAADEASVIYRATARHSLELANSLRLAALAKDALGVDSRDTWHEARALYRRHNVTAGVAECDVHLAR